jgi:hypothetical protein
MNERVMTSVILAVGLAVSIAIASYLSFSREYKDVWVNWYSSVRTHNGGVMVFNGDNSTRVFAIPHNLSSTPAFVVVTPSSSDASGRFYATYNATHIIVNYETAPPAGEKNIALNWYAEAG